MEDYFFARNQLDSSNVMTMRDIARESGYSYQFIRALACGDEKSKPPFPKPYTKLGRSPIWKSDTVWKWIERRGGGN